MQNIVVKNQKYNVKNGSILCLVIVLLIIKKNPPGFCARGILKVVYRFFNTSYCYFADMFAIFQQVLSAYIVGLPDQSGL